MSWVEEESESLQADAIVIPLFFGPGCNLAHPHREVSNPDTSPTGGGTSDLFSSLLADVATELKQSQPNLQRIADFLRSCPPERLDDVRSLLGVALQPHGDLTINTGDIRIYEWLLEPEERMLPASKLARKKGLMTRAPWTQLESRPLKTVTNCEPSSSYVQTDTESLHCELPGGSWESSELIRLLTEGNSLVYYDWILPVSSPDFPAEHLEQPPVPSPTVLTRAELQQKMLTLLEAKRAFRLNGIPVIARKPNLFDGLRGESCTPHLYGGYLLGEVIQVQFIRGQASLFLLARNP